MLIKQADPLKSSDITPYDTYLKRRQFIAGAGVLTAAAGLLGTPQAAYSLSKMPSEVDQLTAKIIDGGFNVDREPDSWEYITTYNNFYEFGTGKRDPSKNARDFQSKPWSLRIFGECDKTGIFGLEDFIKPHALEDRIYRLRCV